MRQETPKNRTGQSVYIVPPTNESPGRNPVANCLRGRNEGIGFEKPVAVLTADSAFNGAIGEQIGLRCPRKIKSQCRRFWQFRQNTVLRRNFW